MDDKKLDEIKQLLREEQQLEAKLKKNPNLSADLVPRINDLYHRRVAIERGEWGCGIHRDLWHVLKSVLLEQANLEAMLNDGHSDNQDIERLINIARSKRDMLVDEIEKTRNPAVSCPVTSQSPSSIASYVRSQCESYISNKQKQNKKGGNKRLRKEMIRLLSQM